MAGKSHRLVFAWFAISGLIVFTAVRQIQTSVAAEAQARKPLPPPARTRHAVRPVVLPWNGDPMADYAQRCAKGIADPQIGWILGDFRNAGLSLTAFKPDSSDEAFLTYRAAQNRWYHAALVDGLRLSPEQSRQVMAGLRDRFGKLRDAFAADRRDLETGKRPELFVNRFNQILSPYWLMGTDDWLIPDYSNFLPWELCTLTPQQERFTRKLEILLKAESDPSISFPAEPRFPDHPLFQHANASSPDSRLPEPWQILDIVMPITKAQSLDPLESHQDPNGKNLLANLRKLHPAQFKILLIISPDLADAASKALDGSR